MKRAVKAISAACGILILVASATAATIPAGTQLSVRITENLSSANAKVGQAFHGTLEAPIMSNGRVVYPKGAQVTGKVVGVHASGRLSDPGVLDLQLVSVTNGRSLSTIGTQVFHIKGESHAKSNVAKIGGTAAAGTLLGAIFGGGKGALIGAGAGAAAGTAAAAATGKKEAKVESEAVLPFVIAGATDNAVAAQPAATQPEAPPPQIANAQPAPQAPQMQPAYGEEDQPTYSRRDRGDDDRDNDGYRRDSRYRDDNRDRDRYAREFSDDDRRIIRSCYAEDYSNLPPGLAKRGGNLPPGLERHIERDGTLPPGLQKRVRLLPRSCERRLPPVPDGWFRAVLGGRILLLDADYRIIDMFFLRGED